MKNYLIIFILMVSSTVFSQNYFYALDEEPTAPDTEAPSAPIDLIVNNIAYTTVDLSWTAATDNVGVVNYKVLIYDSDDVLIKSTTITNVISHTEIDLLPDTIYSVTIRAIDAALNESSDSNKVTFTTKSHGPNMLLLFSPLTAVDTFVLQRVICHQVRQGIPPAKVRLRVSEGSAVQVVPSLAVKS